MAVHELMSPPERLAMMKPRLPRAAELVPYLERIDASHNYSNWGVLCCELQQRLGEKLSAPAHAVVCANSGFSALVAAILAHEGWLSAHSRPLAVVPSYTFTATAMAAVSCGYTPLFVDVDPNSWALEPQTLLAQIQPWLEQVGLVLPVAPYGRPLDYAAWVAFQREHGLPVVIDAAASFEQLFTGQPWLQATDDVPLAVSFHATKTFASAEGGAVLSFKPWQERLMAALNFGFCGTRESRMMGINGKMSEYHAAIGLAELDTWPAKQAQLQATARQFRHIASQYQLEAQFIAWPQVASCYVFFQAHSPQQAQAVSQALAAQQIETRHWYSQGLHQHSAYQSALCAGNLAVSEQIGQCLVGLPLHFAMPEAAMHRIMHALTLRES